MITLATLEKATARQIFDQVKNHLLTQNEKCQLVAHGACAYRNKEGLKCAAGCLISDDEYSENFECKNWQVLVESRVVPTAHYKLIKTLQMIHDESNPDRWAEQLHSVEQNLQYYE